MRDRLLLQLRQRDGRADVLVPHRVFGLGRDVGVVSRRDVPAGAEHDEVAAPREAGDVGPPGDRLASGLEQGQPRIAEPPGSHCAVQIELPQVAVQVTRIDQVGHAIAVGVDGRCRRQPVRAPGSAGTGIDLSDQCTGLGVDDEQEGVPVRVVRVVAAADDHRPPAVVGLHDQRLPEDIAHVRVGELPTHDAGGLSLREIGGVRDVQGEEALGPGAHARHQQRVPAAVVENIANGGRAVDQIAVRVVQVGQLAEARKNRRRHIGQHLVAGRGVDRVQHAVVGSHVDDLVAGKIGRHEAAVRHRLDVVVVTEARRADIVGGRVDDVAERCRVAVAELQRAQRAIAGLQAGITAQVAVARLTVAVVRRCGVQIECRALAHIEFGRGGRAGSGRPAKRYAAQAEAGRRLVSHHLALGVPVLILDLGSGIPGRDGAECASVENRERQQVAGPVRAVELGLVDRRARVVRPAVQCDRGGRAGLGLNVADDGLEGRRELVDIVAEERSGRTTAQIGHLVQCRHRTRVGHRVAHPDHIGLHVVSLAAVEGGPQGRQLSEHISLRLTVGPVGVRVQRVVEVGSFCDRVKRAIEPARRVAVSRQHHEIALAGL